MNDGGKIEKTHTIDACIFQMQYFLNNNVTRTCYFLSNFRVFFIKSYFSIVRTFFNFAENIKESLFKLKVFFLIAIGERWRLELEHHNLN